MGKRSACEPLDRERARRGRCQAYGLALALAGTAALPGGCGTYNFLAGRTAGGEALDPNLASDWSGELVTSGPQDGKAPSLLALADGNWALAYGTDQLGNKRIYYSTSRDGKNWSSAISLPTAGLTDQDPALFQDDHSQHLIFSSNRDGVDFALYESTLAGSSWSPAVRLPLPGAMQVEPAVTRTPSGFALVYQSGDGMVFCESPDGQNWKNASLVVQRLGDPAVTQVGNDLVIVAHRAGSLVEIDRLGTGKWSDPKVLSLATGALSQPVLATAASGKAALAFALAASLDDYSQLAVCDRQGSAWGQPRVVTGASFDNVNPSLQFESDGRMRLAWGIHQSGGYRGIFSATTLGRQGTATAATSSAEGRAQSVREDALGIPFGWESSRGLGG